MKIAASLREWFNVAEIESLAQQAFEGDLSYRRYEEWRLDFRTQIKRMLRAIKFPLGISPAALRDLLLQRQIDLEANIVSPLNYYFYLQRLERILLKRYQLLKGYRYAFKEARVRLLDKLKENPDVALDYFYQDIVNHIVRSSNLNFIPNTLLKALSFYKSLVPDFYYQKVVKSVAHFYRTDKKLSNRDYRIQLQNIGRIFNSSVIESDENLPSYFSQGMNYLMSHPMSIFVPIAMGAIYYQYQQSVAYQTIGFLTQAVSCYALRYTSSNFNSKIGLMAGFANLLPVISAQNTTYYSEALMRNTGAKWFSAHISTGFRFDAGDFLWMGVYTQDNNKQVSHSFSLDLANNGTLLDVSMLQGALSNSAVYDVAKLNNGDVVAVGYVKNQTNINVLIAKFSVDGDYQWSRQISKIKTKGLSIMPAADNAFVLLIADNEYATMVKFSNNGSVLWWANEMPPFTSNEQQNIPAVTVTTDGNPVVISSSGSTDAESGEQPILSLAKINNDNGQLLWTIEVPTFSTIPAFNTITALKNGGIVAVVKSSDNAIVIMKFSDNGDFVWGKKLEPNQETYTVQDIARASNGNVVIMMSAYNSDSESNSNVLLFELQSSNGQLLWRTLLAQIANKLIGSGSISIDIDGGLIIALPIDYLPSHNNNMDGGFYIAKLLSNGSLPLSGCNDDFPFSFDFTDIFVSPIPSNVTAIVSPYPVSNITFSGYYDDTGNWTATQYCSSIDIESSEDYPRFTETQIIISAATSGVFLLGAIATTLFCCIKKPCRKSDLESLPLVEPEDSTIPGITLHDELGKGSYGTVYKATWNNNEVAIKVMNSEDKNVLSRYEREVQIMEKLNHPNVVRFYYATYQDSSYYIIMEYCCNGSLRSLLDQKSNLSLDIRHQFALEIALGLEYLHKSGVIHRDLKCANVVLDKDNHAKLCDFGLSAEIKGSYHSSSGSIAGTPAWMAPELFERQPCSTKTDVYSYGVTLWEIITEEDPSKQKQLAIPEQCSVKYAKLLADCWNKRTRPNADEIVQRLQENESSIQYPSNSQSIHGQTNDYSAVSNSRSMSRTSS